MKKQIKLVIQQIVDKYRPQRIILFGSAAKGRYSPDSDLDLCIVKNDVPSRGIDRIYEIDRLIDRNGVALDILVFKPSELDSGFKQGDPFVREIVNKGKVLYG